MESLDAFVLGLVQGLTEYLPVSSSGHLVLGREVLGVEEPDLFFDIIVHVATLVVTLVFYAKPVLGMLRESARGGLDVAKGSGLGATLKRYPSARLSLWVVVGTIPTGLIGVGFKDTLESLFDSPSNACIMLLVTAGLLLATRLRRGERREAEMTWRDALVIGLVQGFAIVPGISRSGSTIAAALLLGLDRELAARFSFLLSVPAILGALVLQLGDVSTAAGAGVVTLSIGFAAALVTGFLALAILLPMVRRGQLHWFAFYLVPVAVLGLIILP